MEAAQDADGDTKSRELAAPDKRDDKKDSVEGKRQQMIERIKNPKK